MVNAYCVKCKKKGQKMKNAKIVMTARGGYMAKGQCPDCGTTMCAMMSKEKAEAAMAAGEAEKAF